MKRHQRDILRMRGANDAKLGKPIEAFYESLIPRERLTESMRAEYEIGYRAAKAEILKEANNG